nr:hypothetical protein [Acidobacteriota bacterium]
MTLLTIAQSVGYNVGISEPPQSVFGVDGNDERQLLQFTTEAGRELERRVDWGSLRKSEVIAGTGSDSRFNLPADFSRLVEGAAVYSAGVPLRGGLSAEEWSSLTITSGTPRYFRLDGAAILIYPYPLAGVNVTVSYQSQNWTGSGTAWTSDGQVPLVPEDLIERGAVWRWKRHISAEYQDYVAEFEAALADRARFE